MNSMASFINEYSTIKMSAREQYELERLQKEAVMDPMSIIRGVTTMAPGVKAQASNMLRRGRHAATKAYVKAPEPVQKLIQKGQGMYSAANPGNPLYTGGLPGVSDLAEEAVRTGVKVTGSAIGGGKRAVKALRQPTRANRLKMAAAAPYVEKPIMKAGSIKTSTIRRHAMMRLQSPQCKRQRN